MKKLLFPALSASLLLIGCASEQLTPSAPLSVTVSQTQSNTQDVHFTYQAPSFRTQAVTASSLKYIKLSLVGDGIEGTLDNGELVEVSSKGSAAATISKVPIQPGRLRVLTVQGYDADKNPLLAFVGKGFYKSRAGVATVNTDVSRHQWFAGKVLELLLKTHADLASRLDLNYLQSEISKATGFDVMTQTFALDPTLLKPEVIAQIIIDKGFIPKKEVMLQQALITNTVGVYFDTIEPKPIDEAFSVRISDPSTKVQNMDRGTVFPQGVDLDKVSPGEWILSAYNADDKVFASTAVTVDADGVIRLQNGQANDDRLLLDGILLVPTAVLSVSPATVNEQDAAVVYTATLERPTSESAEITLDNGVIIAIEAGQTTGSQAHTVKGNDPYVNDGIKQAKITEATGGGFFSILIDETPVSVNVVETTDTVTASLAVSKASANEGESLRYTATLTAPSQGNTSITLSNLKTITIPDGETTGFVDVEIPDDVYVSPDISVQITGATNTTFERLTFSSTPVVTDVIDIVTATSISISGPSSFAEGSSASITSTLQYPSQGVTTVQLNIGSITIANGQTSGQTSVSAPDDVYSTPQAPIARSINGVSNPKFEKLVVGTGSVTLQVTNVTTPIQATLTGPSSATEGNTITYTARLPNLAPGTTVLQLKNGGSITIFSGDSSGSTSVTVPDDPYISSGAGLVEKITGVSQNGGFESLTPAAGSVSTSVSDVETETTLTINNFRYIGDFASADIVLSHPMPVGQSMKIDAMIEELDGSSRILQRTAQLTIPGGSSKVTLTDNSLLKYDKKVLFTIREIESGMDAFELFTLILDPIVRNPQPTWLGLKQYNF